MSAAKIARFVHRGPLRSTAPQPAASPKQVFRTPHPPTNACGLGQPARFKTLQDCLGRAACGPIKAILLSDHRRMMPSTLASLAVSIVVLLAAAGAAFAQPGATISDGVVKIGLLLDLSGPYATVTGSGSETAARMAVADFGGTVLGRPVIVDALNDHNKPAEAPGLATQAYDAGSDLLMDLQNTPIALAIAKIANERHKPAISTGSAAPALPRGAVSRYVYHY